MQGIAKFAIVRSLTGCGLGGMDGALAGLDGLFTGLLLLEGNLGKTLSLHYW